MVLLKNKNVLPFSKSDIKSLAVIGPNAEKGQFIGGGSATVKPHYVVHPLEGLTENLKESVEVKYAKGCHTHKFLPALEKDLISCPKTGESGFLVEFYKGEDLAGDVLESSVMRGGRFWALTGFGIDIASKMETPSLSVRFTASLSPQISGEHMFELVSIGPARLKVNPLIMLTPETAVPIKSLSDKLSIFNNLKIKFFANQIIKVFNRLNISLRSW